MSEETRSKIEQLEQAVAAQEGLRGTLDDAIVDATIGALRKQLAELKSSPEAEQQRKLMTVLFVDVVDSTSLFRELDPEENLAIMDAALQQMAEPVERLGGRILRFMGDGYLGVFGLPRARENDPEMAVRAGLSVLKTAQTIAENLRAERNLAGFQVRVGVNTGLVVAGGVTEGEGTIMGSAVNLAARLESSAPAGGLLISQHTHQHVRGLFEFEPGGAIEAKGFAQPVQVYLVKGARQRAFRLTTRGVEGVKTRMIGREEELGLLQEAMKSVTQGRGSKVISVIGDAGLGKSRLLAEFENWLNLQGIDFHLLKGRASLETLEQPYGLLRDLIAQRVGILDDDPLSEVRKKIVDEFREAMGKDRISERNAHFVGQLLGYDFRHSRYLQGILEKPRQIRDRALVYLAGYLRALSAERPLAIFLEDVHWADASSLDVFIHLFNELPDQQIMVVALTRPSLFERRASWGDGEWHQQLILRPLSLRDSERLVGEVLQKVQDLPNTLRDLITENAEGNPFYLEELIKMLVEDGVIVKSDPTWRVKADRMGEVRIPATLTGVLQSRIEGLPLEERRILQQASVIGKVFWDEAICYMEKDETSDRIDTVTIKRNLETLQTREMIFEHSTSAFSDAVEYLFKHAVLREVTYESVLKRMRRVYHALVADWLIAHSGDREAQITGLIAGHLEKAGKVGKALEYFIQAAETAVSNYALDEAADFYIRALNLTPEEDLERRYSLLRGRLKVLDSQGNRTSQRTELETLTELADILSDDLKRAEVSLSWAWLFYWVGDFPEAMATAKRTLTLAEAAELPLLAGQAHNVAAWVGFQINDYDNARIHAEMAIELAREENDRNTERNALVGLGLINTALGNYSAARSVNEKALAVAREANDPAQEANTLGNLGVPLTLLGDFQSARDMYQQLLDISRDMGDVASQAVALTNLGWVSSALGNWVQARDHALASVELSRRIHFYEGVAEGLIWLGHAWFGLGQTEKATAAYQESLELRRTLNQFNLTMEGLAGVARAALAQSDLPTAMERVNEILSYLAAGGSLDGTWEPLRVYLTCVQVLEAAEDARAADILEEAYEFLQERATRIADENDRRSYLENVPWHREIVTIWESRL